MEASKMKKIFIVTGEASGDKLASTVISNLNKLNSNIVSFQPKEGMLVLFPSYLQHSVNANKTNHFDSC